MTALTREQIEKEKRHCEFEAIHTTAEVFHERYKRLMQICDLALLGMAQQENNAAGQVKAEAGATVISPPAPAAPSTLAVSEDVLESGKNWRHGVQEGIYTNHRIAETVLNELQRLHAALPAVVRLPEKVKLPCDCYNGELMSGCECGNYDDAHSQGYAQGWNDAIDSAMRGSK